MDYFLKNLDLIIKRSYEHLSILTISIIFAIIIGVSLGIYIYKNEKIANFVIGIFSVLFTIPSLALFGILIVILSPFKAGIGKIPSIIALTLYSTLPIIRNTYTSIKQIDPSIIEAAKGMGMTDFQIVKNIRIPLSLPIIMAGIRNSVVIGVGITTIAFLIGAGGLGYFIFEGIERTNRSMILSGVFVITLLGIGLNYLLIFIEDILTPKGLKVKKW